MRGAHNGNIWEQPLPVTKNVSYLGDGVFLTLNFQREIMGHLFLLTK